jgi:hypothetical protein
MKKLLLQPKSLIVGLALMCSVSAFSQLDPNSGSGGSGADGDPDAPIDGGVSLLIAAGAAAGARKIYKNKKEKNTSEI